MSTRQRGGAQSSVATRPDSTTTVAASITKSIARPRIGPPLIIGILLLGYFAIATIAPLLAGGSYLCDNDFGGIFLPSARYVVAGQPLDMYHVRIGIYPNANGPLGEIIIAVALAVGRLLNLHHLGTACLHTDAYPLPQDSVGLRMWFMGVFALVPLGIGIEIMRLADRWRRVPLSGWQRLAAWVLILSTLPMWDSLVYYGHVEQEIEVLLALWAARAFGARRVFLSGVLLGLALLNRTAGIFVAFPLVLLLLRDRRWRDVIVFGTALVGVVGLGILPFYLHNAHDVIYSLSSFRATEPVLDGSFWTFFRGTPLESRVQGWDSTTAMLLAIIVSAALLWRGRMRADDPAFYGVICASVVCFSIGLKAIWGYYFTEPLLWGLAWSLASDGIFRRWWQYGIIPLFFSLLMALTEVRITIASVPSDLSGEHRSLVLLLSAAEAITLVGFQLILLLILRKRPEKPPEIHETPEALPARSMLV